MGDEGDWVWICPGKQVVVQSLACPIPLSGNCRNKLKLELELKLRTSRINLFSSPPRVRQVFALKKFPLD
jgi:hypothetical protein